MPKTMFEILQTEFSPEFVKAMQNRVTVSYYKYGPIAQNIRKLDTFQAVLHQLSEYKHTHNTEYLVDAANYLMFEFMYPQYQDACFEGTDSDKSVAVPR